MRLAEGRSRSGPPHGIEVLVLVLLGAALTPAVLGEPTMPLGSHISAGVSSDAVVFGGAGSFAPPHSDSGYDANGNGLFDFLLVNASLQISSPGNFTVLGTLHDPSFTLQVRNSTSAGLPSGPANLTIWFDGGPINQSGLDGPYTVDLLLLNESFALLDIGTHTTQPYSYLDFDPIPAFMTPPHPDSGQDTNGNGLFDLLNVDVQIYANVPGNYTVSAFLHDANFTLTMFVFGSAFLPIGPGSIRVSFLGGVINQSGIDGPYIVELQLSEVGSSLPLGMNTTTTQAYSHLAFDPIPAFMTPPHPDSGQDTNGNSLFDFLNVDVQVQANVADNYTVYGFLHNANFTLTLFASGSTFLPVGPGSIRVPFPGPPINQSGVDGPYIVELQLSRGISTPQILGMNTTVTQAYSHLAFDAPAPIIPIQSSAATTTPTIDGAFTAGEWSDATLVDLTNISGNNLPANLYVKNNATMLFMAYDAFGDTSSDSDDAASLAFDTGNDTVASDGHEDQFVQGGFFGNPAGQSHWVYGTSNGTWIVQDAPYNQSLPDHAGLASAQGFGPGLGNATDHRLYEFAVPLALLGANPGETLGFFGGSLQSPGVVDGPLFRYSLWPTYTARPNVLASYGSLILASVGGDTTPPTIVLASPTPGELFALNSVTVTWNASDSGSGLDRFEVRVDGGLVVTLPAGTFSYNVTFTGDGPHTIEVTAYDAAGNSAPASVSVTVDTTPPAVSIMSPSAGATLPTTTVAMTWTASDATSGLDHLELSLDGGAAVNLSATETNHTFVGLSEGSHSVTLAAFDVAGHSTNATRAFAVDTISPIVTISSPAAGYVLTRNVPVTWNASDTGSGLNRIEVSLDSGAPIVLPGSATGTTLTGVSDGLHTITVQAFDQAGHSATDSVSVTVDATLPTVSLTAPVSGQVLGTSSVQLTWTASDSTSGIDHFEVSLDTGTATSLAGSATTFTFSGVSDGSHTFNVRAFDRAGNSATSTVTAVVDVTAPATSITSPTASSFVGSHDVTVTWTASDLTSGIDHFLVSIDGGTAQTAAGAARSYTFTGVPDGSHPIQVTAVDRAGHTALASVTVTVDATAPTLSIVGPSSGAVITTAAMTVTWTTSDSTSGVDHIEVRVDGGAAHTLASDATSYPISGLADGTHAVNVTVFDRAGNSKSGEISFRTDTSFISPSGPYGIIGLTSIFLLIAVVIVAAALILRRRRHRKLPR